jgi:hypothetical protein
MAESFDGAVVEVAARVSAGEATPDRNRAILLIIDLGPRTR